MADVEVRMYLDHVQVVVERATAEVLKRLGFRIQERAQLNIRSNDQIDTGFMVNSIYTVWQGGDDYGRAKNEAESNRISNRTGKIVDHQDDMAPKADLVEDAAAAVVVGANYAIYQEVSDPFLFPAAQAAAAEFGGEATQIYREVLPEEGSRV